MTKNIFVLGLLDWQRRELETIEHANECVFHDLLPYEDVALSHRGFDELLAQGRSEIAASGVKPDAIICHWDFPSSCLAPVLAHEHGLRAPSLEAKLKCEHKYWARLEQRKVVPECTPEFQALDPFDPEAPDKLELEFPIWLKPIKGFSSLLGFRIENRDELRDALKKMRADIGELGKPFDECLAHADLPSEVQGIGGSHALAEGIMTGVQFAPEGYVQNGEVHIHGFFDMPLDQDGKAVAGLRYPADQPQALQDRAADVCRRIMRQVGFDDGSFNVEFLYDADTDKLWVIEVNTRISQSHCEMFRKVDGMSNHEVAVSVALGTEPHLPRGQGHAKTAAKFHLTKNDDAQVTRIPDESELAALEAEFDAMIELNVQEGDRLSDLPNQPVYCFNVADAWIGGNSIDELQERYRRLGEKIPIEFSDARRLSP